MPGTTSLAPSRSRSGGRQPELHCSRTTGRTPSPAESRDASQAGLPPALRDALAQPVRCRVHARKMHGDTLATHRKTVELLNNGYSRRVQLANITINKDQSMTSSHDIDIIDVSEVLGHGIAEAVDADDFATKEIGSVHFKLIINDKGSDGGDEDGGWQYEGYTVNGDRLGRYPVRRTGRGLAVRQGGPRQPVRLWGRRLAGRRRRPRQAGRRKPR